MEKIALFGATGKTGTEFLTVALQNGHHVKALARTPEKLAITHKNLEVLAGDILNQDDVLTTIKGCDLVVSLFGQVKGSPKRLQTMGTKHIVDAMKQEGLEKSYHSQVVGFPSRKKMNPNSLIKLFD